MEMDAQDLRLRDRVHHAYDALDVRAPSTVAVLRRVEARVHRRAQVRQRAWIGAALFAAAGIGALSVVGIQLVPRGVQLRQTPSLAQNTGNLPGRASYGAGGATTASGGNSSGPAMNAAQGQASLGPCAPRDLAVAVSTDHSVYGMGDVVTISSSVTNRGHEACEWPGWSSVSVHDGQGTSWSLCPETDWPPPSPTPMPSAATVPPADAVGQVPASRPGTAFVRAEFAPGQSESVVCTWHTQYRNLRPGIYWVGVSWGGVSATASFTLLQLDPTPSPTPEPSPTPTPILPRLP